MGNSGSNRRHHHHHHHHSNIPPPTPPPHGRSTHSQFVFAAATPYPSQYPNQYYPHFPAYYPPPAVPGTYSYHQVPPPGQYYQASSHPQPVPTYVEHQKAVTIRNDVNVKKETLKVEPDEENPGKFLVSFTFDATAPGSITVMFFGKEDVDCNLIPTKEDVLKQITIPFQQGIGQNFRQPSGAGIDFSMFDEAELTKVNDAEVYPLIVKAEAHPSENTEAEANHTVNSQITMAVFERKEKGQWHAQVIKQILWVNRVRYELQEIYGIGSTAGGGLDENDSGKDCVICLSEPRDTTVLPCRHMCMCSECAKVLQFQTNRCPICRQPVERLLEIKVSNGSDDGGISAS